MPREQIELEFTFNPPDGAELPDLSVLLDVESVDPVQEYDLEAVYFDTAQLSLAQSGVTLRRRSGGPDDGWHLKLPTIGGSGRTEISLPLARAVRTPPKPLRNSAIAWTRERSLVAVAAIRTKRRVQRLRATDGSVLAELCDDTVQGESLLADHAHRVTWREWELEFGTGSKAQLRRACDLLKEAAGEPTSGGSKLARTLGEDLPQVSKKRTSNQQRPTSARTVIARRLSEQVAALKIHDSEVRRDAPDGIHQARVTIRRLRSALTTFRPLLHRSAVEPVRAELQWIGGVLSDARDAEVLRIRFPELLDRDPAELVPGRVRRRIDSELKRAYQVARAHALEAMQSPRYLQLLDSLDELITIGAWAAEADRAARDVLPRRVQRDLKRLRRRVRTARDARPEDADPRWHEARKAAKRVRYAAETLRPIYGKDAKRLAKKAKRIQSALGAHHDSVVARQALQGLAVQAHTHGVNAFTYGRLHGLEQARADAALQRFEKAWSGVNKPRIQNWLK